MFIDSKTYAALDSRVTAVADSVDGCGKRALLAPESVMRFFQTVKTYTYIRKAYFLKFGRNLFGNQCAVRGNDSAHSFVRRVLRQFQQILPQKRLAAGKENHR